MPFLKGRSARHLMHLKGVDSYLLSSHVAYILVPIEKGVRFLGKAFGMHASGDHRIQEAYSRGWKGIFKPQMRAVNQALVQ